jgi:hypothetical protein
MAEKEIVYVLTNPAMPGLAKIGKTTQADVMVRMNQLYTTGVPVPFECVYAVEVKDCSRVESALHIAFGPSRINPSREFFKIDTEQAIAVLKLLEGVEVTPQLNAQLNANVSQAEKDSAQKMKKRPNMNFVEMGIPIGAILTYQDGQTTVEVVQDKKVKFNGNIMSLTAATREVMGIDYSVQPAPYWTYQGKLLRDYYEETYAAEDDT